MVRLAVERVVPMREGAQSDGVEREPGEVRGDIDRLISEARPLCGQRSAEEASLTFWRSCDAMSFIPSNMFLIDSGPKAGTRIR